MNWDPLISQRGLLFAALQTAEKKFSEFSNWPDLSAFNQALDERHQGLKFVGQQPGEAFSQQYEPRIFLTGEIQTRKDNWHDFFNMLIWLSFPQSKRFLNNRQYHAMLEQRKNNKEKQRTAEQNILAHFDECGVCVFSSDEELIALLKDFSWKEVFYQRKQQCIEKMEVMVFGHGLYEKALQPYVGLTGKAIYCKVEPSFLKLSQIEKLQQMDRFIVDYFSENSAAALYPLPILGVPGWHYVSQDELFYDNTDYFRTKRKK